LVDNIPLVSDSGLSNNIDLMQINIDDVERIKIAKNPWMCSLVPMPFQE